MIPLDGILERRCCTMIPPRHVVVSSSIRDVLQMRRIDRASAKDRRLLGLDLQGPRSFSSWFARRPVRATDRFTSAPIVTQSVEQMASDMHQGQRSVFSFPIRERRRSATSRSERDSS